MITIVSGLPRSGTSLMMQMLSAGGAHVLSDGERIADADNPRGYWEWERIKQLPKDPACIEEAEGKVVKVVSQLLYALPAGHDYQIIFMERPLPEVVASQAEMIRRRKAAGPALPESALIAALKAHLNQVNAWLALKPGIRVMRIEYHSVLQDPRGSASSLRSFLQTELDVESMARQVDPSLYRQRSIPDWKIASGPGRGIGR
jgi:LPS sulfotransferase NodH